MVLKDSSTSIFSSYLSQHIPFFPKQDSVGFLLLLNKKKGRGGDKKEEYSNSIKCYCDNPGQ